MNDMSSVPNPPPDDEEGDLRALRATRTDGAWPGRRTLIRLAWVRATRHATSVDSGTRTVAGEVPPDVAIGRRAA
jgi:hypothetical protein